MLLSGVLHIALLASLDFHLPGLLKRQSWTPKLAAVIAPSSLRLYKLNLSEKCPKSISFLLNSSLNILHIYPPRSSNLFTILRFNNYSEKIDPLQWSMPAILRYLFIRDWTHAIWCSGYQDFITLSQLIHLARSVF